MHAGVPSGHSSKLGGGYFDGNRPHRDTVGLLSNASLLIIGTRLMSASYQTAAFDMSSANEKASPIHVTAP